MDLFGDPFAQIGNTLASQRTGGAAPTGGYPGPMSARQHGRFMSWQQGQNDAYAAVLDRHYGVVQSEAQLSREHEVAMVQEHGNQQRRTASSAVRNANKLNPGVSVAHDGFSATRLHEPTPPPAP